MSSDAGTARVPTVCRWRRQLVFVSVFYIFTSGRIDSKLHSTIMPNRTAIMAFIRRILLRLGLGMLGIHWAGFDTVGRGSQKLILFSFPNRLWPYWKDQVSSSVLRFHSPTSKGGTTPAVRHSRAPEQVFGVISSLRGIVIRRSSFRIALSRTLGFGCG